MLKTILTLAFTIGVFTAWSQQNTVLLKLQKIEPIQHIEFVKTNQNQYLSFKPAASQLLVFDPQKTMEAGNKASNQIFRSVPDNMPVLGFGTSTSKWNMPVAVPDSTVDYYIKNPMLPGASNLVFRK